MLQQNTDEINLNYEKPIEDGNYKAWKRVKEVKIQNTCVYFDNLEQKLIEHIQEADVCLGCVAWLTNKAILDELAKKRRVSIIVQKEDFLRPDYNFTTASNFVWKQRLHNLYKDLPSGVETYSFYGEAYGGKVYEPELYSPPCRDFSEISTRSTWQTEAVRCMGNYNSSKNPAFPRMHHKFLLFCHKKAYAVWTGSFNFTENATRSMENALYITEPSIVDAYWQEWAYIFALSEQLNWDSEWSLPEFRVGT